MSSDNHNGGKNTGGGTARRVLSSILETSGLVCGSLKNVAQDKLADNDMDMKWVEHGIDNIKTKLEEPREKILNLTDKACRRGELSPKAYASGAMAGSFMDENTLGCESATVATEARTLTISTEDLDDDTMASTLVTADTTRGGSTLISDATPPKIKSRFAPVVDEAKKRERAIAEAAAARAAAGGTNVVIGLCLSRKDFTLGHPDTVTRQTAFDFNELQDRDYKYVSSTDDSGWLAGGGERGDPYRNGVSGTNEHGGSDDSDGMKVKSFGAGHKTAAPDRVYIPILQINAASAAVIDEIISALARGEIFIPEVSILPETLTVNNKSPPDLQLRFGCEKNDDTPPEEWSNWPLEFLHNQLYDYFAPMGAQWSKRPFQITLARKVRWMSVKHMNKYFSRSEQVINSWREKGPQYLQPPYSDDSRGVILEEITRPHGIYLIQNGVPTNYFAPNFHPPYTTKMRRSLIQNVISKSWDAKHRDWLSEPVPRMRGPVQLISSVMGCANPGHLSPVEEHMREDFDLSESDSGLGVRPKTPELEGRKSEAHRTDKQKNDSQRRHKEERNKVQGLARTPSDDYYFSDGTSTRPSGTLSLSVEETMTDSANDPITACRSSGELSPDRESLDDDAVKKHFFNGDSRPDRNFSFESSKEVSFSDSSIAESERERNDREQQWRQRLNERQKANALQRVDDRRGDKFAKPKVC